MDRIFIFIVIILVEVAVVPFCTPVYAEDLSGKRKAFPLLWSGADEATANRKPHEPIVTDRPDFTEASSTVGLGVSQFEVGYTYYYSDRGNAISQEHVYPEVLLRQGILADWIELRVGQTWNSFELPNDSSSERQDAYLGTKIALVPQRNFLPEMAVILQANLPTGEGQSQGDQILPGMNLLYSWDLSERTYLGGGTQINAVESSTGGDQGIEVAQALTMGTQISELFGVYGEWFAFMPLDVKASETSHWFNTGVTIAYNPNVQFDVRVGTELSRVSKDIFTGAGVSFRLM